MSHGVAYEVRWRELASAVACSWAGDEMRLEVRETPRTAEHLVAMLHDADGARWFVKAFGPDQGDYFERELDVYRAASPGTAPALRHVNVENRLLIIDVCRGGRLGDLGTEAQTLLLEGIAPLFSRMLDLPVGASMPRDRSGFVAARAAVSGRPEAAALPEAGEVLALLAGQDSRPVHGDFHPLNVLVDHGALRVVDFESYGIDLPGFDIARMAFNPALRIDTAQRLGLVREMASVLEADHRPSDREIAACCVHWAVSCAVYFSSVLKAAPDAAGHSPEVPVLAVEPLVLAAEFWNGVL